MSTNSALRRYQSFFIGLLLLGIALTSTSGVVLLVYGQIVEAGLAMLGTLIAIVMIRNIRNQSRIDHDAHK